MIDCDIFILVRYDKMPQMNVISRLFTYLMIQKVAGCKSVGEPRGN